MSNFLTTAQVCSRYEWTHITISRKINTGEFPAPTHRGRPNKWLVSVLDAFDRNLAERSMAAIYQQRSSRIAAEPNIRSFLVR